LDTIHQALISHTIYTYTITNFGNPASLKTVVWSNSVEVIFNALIALLVQSFLAMRVWRFSNHNKLLIGVIALLIIAEFVTIMISTAWSLEVKTYARLAEVAHFSIAVNAIAVAGDILLTASLAILLHRSRTGLRRSDTMINKLILYVVNTGLLPSVCSSASLIFLVIGKHTMIFIGFFFCVGRLYTNCLLATLNARQKIRAVVSATVSDDIALSRINFSAMGQGSMGATNNISIKLDTKQESTRDEDEQPDYNSELEKTKFDSLQATAC